jgi:hypothetical protein
MSDTRTPDAWLQTEEFRSLIVLDPDGWDRKNFEEDWARPLTLEEFSGKLMVSTIVPRDSGWDES